MNKIKFSTANLFDNECDVLVGCGSFGFSDLHCSFMQFRANKLGECFPKKINTDTFVEYGENKYIYIVTCDGNSVSVNQCERSDNI